MYILILNYSMLHNVAICILDQTNTILDQNN